MVSKIRHARIVARIITLSNVSGKGVDQTRKLIEPGKTYCLLGSSGVGKTTLVNRLVGDSDLATGAVSHSGEGRHTTTRRQLIVLEHGGLLIDMPGMRELGMLGVSEGIDDSFADIQSYSLSCRYANCTHTSEPGCAIQSAIARGELDPAHLQSHLKLKKESEFHEMSHYVKWLFWLSKNVFCEFFTVLGKRLKKPVFGTLTGFMPFAWGDKLSLC